MHEKSNILKKKRISSISENQIQQIAIKQHSIEKEANKTSNEVEKTSDYEKTKQKLEFACFHIGTSCSACLSFQTTNSCIKLGSSKTVVTAQTVCNLEVITPLIEKALTSLLVRLQDPEYESSECCECHPQKKGSVLAFPVVQNGNNIFWEIKKE